MNPVFRIFSLDKENFKTTIKNKFKEKREERIKFLDKNQAQDLEKRIFLQTIDLNWKSHIQYLEQLRQVIGLRSYGQRDPLIEYKKEAFMLFENLLEKLKVDFITILINLKIITQTDEKINPELKREKKELRTKYNDLAKEVKKEKDTERKLQKTKKAKKFKKSYKDKNTS